MVAKVLKMQKIEFDGFFVFLEETNFELVPYSNTEEGWAAAARWTIVHRLIEDSDYAAMFNIYERYRKMKNFPQIAEKYEAELMAFREQCFGPSSYVSKPKPEMTKQNYPAIWNESIDILALVPRAHNCLQAETILFVGDLIQRSEKALLDIPNLGKTTLAFIKEALEEKGLKLDTDVGQWRTPRNL